MMLLEKLKSLPDAPGVYLMKDGDGRIIYVGKAISLKKRVNSYFQRRSLSPKERVLVSKIRDFECIATSSGVEALVLECNLIKYHRPRYNIRLKDDKRYPIIKLTTYEEFPRLLFVRHQTDDGAFYLGPYTESQNLRKNLRSIRETFPICTSKHEIKAKKDRRPCLDFYIGHCSAPCAGKIDARTYRELINKLILFFKGQHRELISELRQKMEVLAKDRRFEEAAKIRDEIRAIEGLTVKQRVVFLDDLDRDVIALSLKEEEAYALVLNIREGRLIGTRLLSLEGFIEDEPSVLMSNFVKQYYLEKDSLPPEILIEHEILEIETIGEWLSKRAGKRVTIYSPKEGEGLRLVELARENLESVLVKKAKPKKVLDELKEILHLREIPRRIEAFDVSNIKGRLATASLIVFEEGQPLKEAYRRFRIKTLDTPDDVGMIKEVVLRRFKRLLSEKEPLPDLVIIDGGKTQLNAASSVLIELGLGEIALVGIAKARQEEGKEEDRIFTLNRNGPIRFVRDSPVLYLLQQIRDEAHRFAIGYHRRLRRLS